MKIACPNCGENVSLGDRTCGRCGASFGPMALVRYLWRDIGAWSKRITALRCPACQQASPFRAKSCIHCGEKMTFAAAVEVALTPHRARYQNFIDRAGPTTMRVVQWTYVGASFGILWALLGYTERRLGPGWVWQAMLSLVYLAVFGVIGAAIVPRSVWSSVARGTSVVVKLGLIANYLSVLLLLHNAIGVWWGRAMTLGALLLATWIGIWLVCRFLWPVYLDAANLFLGARQRPFDPSAPQGRSARIE